MEETNGYDKFCFPFRTAGFSNPRGISLGASVCFAAAVGFHSFAPAFITDGAVFNSGADGDVFSSPAFFGVDAGTNFFFGVSVATGFVFESEGSGVFFDSAGTTVLFESEAVCVFFLGFEAMTGFLAIKGTAGSFEWSGVACLLGSDCADVFFLVPKRALGVNSKGCD